MNENELREKLVSTAVSFLGCKESNGTHKQIIDIYNGVKPLPSGYKVKYTDAWCATYVSAMGIKAGLQDVVLRECSCNRMIKLYQNAGRWVEDDSYTPKAGDIIFYDWQDTGSGDNKGSSDHVGIVASVSGTTIKVVEGNISDSVGYRNIQINGRYIRGYGIPNYAAKVGAVITTPTATVPKPTVTPSKTNSNTQYNVGDVVSFVGTKHYSNANASVAKSCKPGTAKVTARALGSKHPYHLIAIKGGGSNVYGFVNASDISRNVSSGSTSSSVASNTNSTNSANAKIDSAKSFSKSLAGTYQAIENLNLRSGAGTFKRSLIIIPKNSKVKCYGYYTNVGGVKWYYVTFTSSNGDKFTGFVSSKYLKK